MWDRLDFGSSGYAEDIKQKLIKGCSMHSYLHPYDFMSVVNQAGNLPGFFLEGTLATIELDIDHPQGFGNYFITELHKSGRAKQGQPVFEFNYPNEEFLGYDITDESGYLLTEDGEMIVL